MAADLRFYDDLVDREWLGALTPAALRLLLAIGRWTDRRPMRSRAGRDRLSEAAWLAPRTCRDAWGELLKYGLVNVSTIGGRRYVYLTFPVPPVDWNLVAEIRRARGRKLPLGRQKRAAPTAGRSARRGVSSTGHRRSYGKRTREKTAGAFALAGGVAVEAVEAVEGEQLAGAAPRILTESEPLDLDPAVFLWP